MNDIIVVYASLPRRCHGASVINEDGSFTVFIDPRDSLYVQRKAYMHELEHIENGDFNYIDMKTAGAVENSAHEKDRGKS